MSIRNIQNPNIPDKSVQKTGKSEKSEKATHTEKSSAAGKATSVKSDKFEITGKKFADDIAFAKSILSKIDEKQLDSLKQIRKNIDQGVYDTQKVQDEIGTKFEKDLVAIESFLRTSSESEDPSETSSLSESRIRFLTENEDVFDQITGKILDDLKKL
ncbi:MAG: hypothetical protein WD035_03460 [Balneolaceae bacterium]